MRRCAFLTMADSSGYVVDDALAVEPLRQLGWHVESVPWNRDNVAWEAYDVVVIRSTWDYVDRLDDFVAVLGEIESSGARLENPLELVHWNLRKTYLRDLAERGVPIVPTVWRDRLASGELAPLLSEIPGVEAIVKPAVGASAEGAFRFDRRQPGSAVGDAETYFADRGLMVQPLVRSVLEEGEYSLFYLNGDHSHTVLKTPKADDFRVQEEHGGYIRAVVAERELLHAGAKVLGTLHTTPLYTRVDLVRSDDGASYWLMELELVEPSLYLRMDPGAPARFARSLHERVA